jgi:hypothetical protein
MPKTPKTTEEEVLTPTPETVTPDVPVVTEPEIEATPDPRVWYNFPTVTRPDGSPFSVQALTFDEAVKAKDEFLLTQKKSN